MRNPVLKFLVATVATLGLAAPAGAALVSITGGSGLGSTPSGNDVLGPAGIGFAGGQIWRGGTLRITSAQAVVMSLYFVGSESGWRDRIRLDDDRPGVPTLVHTDEFGAGTGGVYNPIPYSPGKPIGQVQQNPGVADIKFYWADPDPDKLMVSNGSWAPSISGHGRASLAFAYLNEFDEIVSDATNRILVMLNDSFGKKSPDHDYDYDDYVGVLTFTPVPLPAAAWLLLSGLLGIGAIGRRRSAATAA